LPKKIEALVHRENDVFAGIDPDLEAQVEFGAFQKVGDPTTRKAVRYTLSDMGNKTAPLSLTLFLSLYGKFSQMKSLLWQWCLSIIMSICSLCRENIDMPLKTCYALYI
jgi:hypothetical protein